MLFKFFVFPQLFHAHVQYDSDQLIVVDALDQCTGFISIVFA